MGASTHTFIAAALEKAVNAALAYDPATRQKVAQLDGVLAIHVTDLNLHLYSETAQEGLRLTSYHDETVTMSAEISGSLQAFTQALAQLSQQRSQHPASLADSDLSVSGNIGFFATMATRSRRYRD